jgi:aspartyl-tRNA(Asn)/glutamyl-tRNA(Gln) amidotransferase subunit A
MYTSAMDRLDIPKVSSIEETISKIINKEISITDLVKKHIELAKEVQDKTNSFITIFDGEKNSTQYDPIGRANELDELIQSPGFNEEDYPLLGIPFTAKDLYLVKGTLTTFGSRYMKDFIAPYTGTVIKKCLDAGAILIGKNNCDPWGFGGSGENSGFGPAKNPYDLSRTPGGSSSGSAASLAAGVGFFSLGTDTGGSVRQPAAMTGLYGYKPTYGRNSRFGIGTMASSFDTPAFFTRHKEDLELIESIIQGRDENDPTTFDLSKVSSNTRENGNDGPLKIGIPKEFYGDGLSIEIKNAIETKIQEYKEQGHEIVDVSIPSAKYGLAAYYTLVPAEISSNRARYDGVRFGPKDSEDYEENMIEGRSKYFEDEVKRRIMVGTYVLSAGYSDQFYKKASKVRAKIKQEFKDVFENVDVLITPTSPTTAFKLGEKVDDPVEMYLSDIYTVTASIAGIPSLNIPIGEDTNGLPIGMQVMSSWFEDKEIFGI